MICLCLTSPKLSENRALLEANRAWIGLAELRVDRLEAGEFPRIADFLLDAWRDLGIRFILTLRLPEDGGSWAYEETERQALMSRVVAACRTGASQAGLGSSLAADGATAAGGPAGGQGTNPGMPEGPGPLAWVDLEAGGDFGDLESRILEAGAGIIRSFHDFTLTPGNLEKRIDDLCAARPALAGERFLAKGAVMVRGSQDLLVLVQAALNLRQRQLPFILAGMGPCGVASRILAPLLGSYLTFASAAGDGRSAAPGHMDPRTLAEVFGCLRLDARTRIFGIIGNPVLHSRSPAYHNEVFAREDCPAVYVPFQVDDLGAFMKLADLLDIQGFSVTIPHKEGIRQFLTSEEDRVARIGACNTVLRTTTGWHGLNTDAPGFLNPLLPLLDKSVRAALVIGAGGAARGVVQALLDQGLRVLIVNRTPERARELAAEFAAWYPGMTAWGASGGLPAAELAPYSRLVVQTTSAGMEGSTVNDDPLPDYRFDGGELVYDIVYVPERTVFLKRAQAAGCRTLNGLPMFLEQARLQSREFLARCRIFAN